jgi:hypothetical protein
LCAAAESSKISAVFLVHIAITEQLAACTQRGYNRIHIDDHYNQENTMRTLFFVAGLLILAPAAWADEHPVTNSLGATLSRASLRVSGSVAHALATSGQVTLAVSVAPFAIGASVGLVSGSVAGASTNASGNTSANPTNNLPPIGTPLPITSEVMTIIPPNVALQSNTTERKP